MANLSSSDSLQQPWSNSQSKNNSQMKSNLHSTQTSKKSGGVGSGGSNDVKRPNKRLPKKPRKSSSIESLDYDDEQDHMDACFKDSDYGESSVILVWLEFSKHTRGFDIITFWTMCYNLMLSAALKCCLNRLSADGSTTKFSGSNFERKKKRWWLIFFFFFNLFFPKLPVYVSPSLWFCFPQNLFFVNPVQTHWSDPPSLLISR